MPLTRSSVAWPDATFNDFVDESQAEQNVYELVTHHSDTSSSSFMNTNKNMTHQGTLDTYRSDQCLETPQQCTPAEENRIDWSQVNAEVVALRRADMNEFQEQMAKLPPSQPTASAGSYMSMEEYEAVVNGYSHAHVDRTQRLYNALMRDSDRIEESDGSPGQLFSPTFFDNGPESPVDQNLVDAICANMGNSATLLAEPISTENADSPAEAYDTIYTNSKIGNDDDLLPSILMGMPSMDQGQLFGPFHDFSGTLSDI